MRCWALLASVCALCVTIAAGAFAADIDTQIKQEEEKLQKIERQIRFHEVELSKIKGEESDILGELEKLNKQEVLTNQRIELLKTKERKLEGQIKELSAEIAEKETFLTKAKKMLAERLVAIYKFRGRGEFSMLLATDSIHEAMSTTYMLRRITKQDNELINETIDQAKELQSLRQNLEKQKATLQAQRKEQEKEKAILKETIAKREQFLEKLKNQKEYHAQASKELERSQAELERRIQQLLQEKQRLAQLRSGGATLTRPKGKLSWPVNGAINSPFGTRVHPVFKTKTVHTGIDIKASKGTPVKAAEKGEVLFAGWLRGFGQVIIIDHGGDLVTVYAHLSSMDVSEGQRVTRGQTIGRVGNTGVTTAPHLHFEVREGSKAVDPLKYLGQ
ncbi:MAG TPA: peptidoglycan DD-metalloendopeptidase family protein [Thermosynergistes sp.]|nr:peptidoglycan DD-metalloendopeptidase family protein [Thermosynergistes sp.]